MCVCVILACERRVKAWECVAEHPPAANSPSGVVRGRGESMDQGVELARA